MFIIRYQSLFSVIPMNSPKKPKNTEQRTREFLAVKEIQLIRKQARKNTMHGHRNDTLMLMMFKHALRVSEAIDLQWEHVDFNLGKLYVNRLKNGTASTHPLQGETIRALRLLQRKYRDTPFLFSTQQKTPLSARSVHRIVADAGKDAGLPFSIHPHMLRHSTGFYLANKGIDTRTIQEYMGHARIDNTVIYTQLDANRFNNIWR